ncbi:cysteine--tRNA ligase [Candidatus Curtissbacteria bacterium]|nr:cysteine--tRNA ligase [Candidatus Curtissbacteria bacterium]
MKIYNTYSEKIEEIELKQPIGIYVCGITPYDTTHLGHAFTFVTYDILVRYLRFLGANVTYVQNVTDIDDDILIRAHALKTTWKELGNHETISHFKNMHALNALHPDHIPKATENISQMQKIIQGLIKKGGAYVINNSVYFDVKKDKNFGKLSKFNYKAMLEIANDRGNFPIDPNKKNELDFVLWQAQQHPDEPSWNSPWGQGRPGWHIECSAMSMRYLGSTLTIHGGGQDLIFPHHESEIAQSENFTDKKFVKTWMHTAMVYSEGKKMSKSLGNMIFVHDLLKTYTASELRTFLAMHHYRTSFNYDEAEFVVAKNAIKAFEPCCLDQKILSFKRLKQIAPEFLLALDNDLDTSKAFQILTDIAKSKNETKKAIIPTGLKILGIKV